MNFIFEENRIYLNDNNNEMIAEILFPFIKENVIQITRTYVSSTLRGQGVANLLMQNVVELAENYNWTIVPSCSYAEKWFEKNDYFKNMVENN